MRYATPNVAASRSGRRVGDRDDEVGERRQVRAEGAGAESDDALPISTESTSAPTARHDADALAADHRRAAVQPRVHPHGLEHVAEVESGGDDPDLDLIVFGRYPLDRVHRQRVEAAGLIDL